ncbi:MAG: M81 family metallopeptidase [Saprospiraceae bacterium]|nr:M81 family metallopeptidase [Saprospiraceae bacterium]
MQVEKAPKKIGLIGIYHESNTFLTQKTSWKQFEEGHLFFGDRILDEYRAAFHEIGGMIEGLQEESIELVPILYAEATPGGKIDANATMLLLEALFSNLASAMPLDGLLVAPHGAAVSDLFDDFDGYWLSEVRKRVGDIPMIGTLDPHANVSQLMVDATDCLIAYKTNPHIDQRQVGSAAARIMMDTLAGRISPVQYLLQSNVAISIEQQYTAQPPCLPLYEMASELAKQEGVLSSSILLGFPYADVVDMGSAFLVSTDRDLSLAEEIATTLNQYIQKHYREYLGQKISVDEAISQLPNLAKPVLFLDMGDNVGGGSPGDSTFILHALENQGSGKAFICIQDPEAVQILCDLEPGTMMTIRIGGKSDDLHGKPLQTIVTLDKIVNGQFSESQPRHGGQVHFNMGPTAIVTTAAGNTIMLTSLRTVPFSLQQLLHFGLDPASFEVIVAKGVQAPIAAYGPVCPSIVRINTEGVTTADMRKLNFMKRRKPLFPFENPMA